MTSPFQVVDSSLANIMFCNQTLRVGLNVNLTPNQVFDDYKKGLLVYGQTWGYEGT